MAFNTCDAGDIVQFLSHIFANALPLATAGAGGGVGLMVNLDSGQLRRQGLAFGLLLWHRLARMVGQLL